MRGFIRSLLGLIAIAVFCAFGSHWVSQQLNDGPKLHYASRAIPDRPAREIIRDYSPEEREHVKEMHKVLNKPNLPKVETVEDVKLWLAGW